MMEMGKGLDSYMAAADETATELLQGDDGLVAAPALMSAQWLWHTMPTVPINAE